MYADSTFSGATYSPYITGNYESAINDSKQHLRELEDIFDPIYDLDLVAVLFHDVTGAEPSIVRKCLMHTVEQKSTRACVIRNFEPSLSQWDCYSIPV